MLFRSDLFIDHKSLKIEADYVVLGSGELYMSPLLEGSKLDLYAIENRAANTCDTTTNDVTIDTDFEGEES